MDSKEKIVVYIKENYESFYKLAYSYSKQREDALDIVHEAIVKALQNADGLRSGDNIKPWFYRILVNESLNLLRRKEKTLEMDGFEDFEIADSSSSRADDIDLYQSLDGLPLGLKTVILLHYFEGMKLEEIARVTDTNINTVKSRLHRALRLLRVELEVLDK